MADVAPTAGHGNPVEGELEKIPVKGIFMLSPGSKRNPALATPGGDPDPLLVPTIKFPFVLPDTSFLIFTQTGYPRSGPTPKVIIGV